MFVFARAAAPGGEQTGPDLDDSLPCVLLLDDTSHLRWSYNGVFDPGHYRALQKAAAAALGRL